MLVVFFVFVVLAAAGILGISFPKDTPARYATKTLTKGQVIRSRIAAILFAIGCFGAIIIYLTTDVATKLG